MGSESSKSNKNNDNIGVAQEALKFGPSIGSSRSSQYSLNRDQLTHPSTQVKPQQPPPSIPPPVYTKTDPLQANFNANFPSRTSQNIQQPANAPKTGSQTSDVRNSDLKNKQTNASEIGNAANINKPLNQTTSDHLKHQNANKNKVSSQVQPPSYDPVTNRYVYTNDSSKSTIDFEQESQKVSKDVLSGSDIATTINRELNKNKSLAEVRKLLVNNEYLSDVRFVVNSTVFHGHKLFLVTASPLFYLHFEINGSREMRVEGIEEEIFLAMMSFCYTGILHKLTDDNILSTLLAADKLKISQAYTTCCGFITSKINPDGVFVVFEKAIDLKSEQFQKKCLDYIKKNEVKCFSSKGFFKIGLASLVTMLEKCDYPTEKLNEVVEKWNHGPVTQEVKSTTTNNPPGAQNKGGKKKGNPQIQQQQVQKNQQQNAQQQQKPKNQQQQQKVHQNPHQQRNQPNMPNMPHFPQQMQQFQHQNMHHFPTQMQQLHLQNMQQFQQQNMHHVQQQIIQQRNQQQHPSKNPKQNEGQKGKNRQQQNKKQGPGNQQIPNLIDLEIPPPPFAEGYQGSLPVFAAGSSMRHADSMSNLSDDLMCFGGDDDLNALVCVDDDEGGKIKVIIKGTESVGMTEFARIDFIAKRSFVLHEVWFNDNMIQNSNEIRISIAVVENEQRSDIHSRSIKGVSINRCNFIKFTRQPLKIFVGQKFFIKMNFSEQASRKHLDPQNLSSTDFLDLRRDDEVRKYFNCINKLVVSEMA